MWDPHDCTQNLCKMQKTLLCNIKLEKKKSSKNQRIPLRRFFKSFEGGELRFLQEFHSTFWLWKAEKSFDVYLSFIQWFQLNEPLLEKVFLWISSKYYCRYSKNNYPFYGEESNRECYFHEKNYFPQPLQNSTTLTIIHERTKLKVQKWE